MAKQDENKMAVYHDNTAMAEVLTSVIKHSAPSVTYHGTDVPWDERMKRLYQASGGEYYQQAGRLQYARVNDVLLGASVQQDTVSLWGEGLIYENEVTCLFSDTNTGKSVLAVQIGDAISRTGKPVVYVDFELSDVQFYKRYRNDSGETYAFADTFYRCTVPQYNAFDEASAIADIRNLCILLGAKVVIIDNLTWLDTNSELGDAAALLMQELIGLKRQCGLTVIVISHTPKRPMNSPITQNDLSGSKRIVNFLDAALAIGKCVSNPKLRYIKQIKTRSTNFKYDSDNVLVCQLTRGEKDNFLSFDIDFNRTANEMDLLRTSTEKERNRQQAEVNMLAKQGFSCRQISARTGLSKSRVQRIINK